MMFEILKAFVILVIAIPFAYIVFDVVLDIVKRTYGFFQREAKPMLMKVRTKTI